MSGNRLPYAPETLLTFAVGYTHPRGFLAQVEAVHVGEQFTDDLNSVAAPADGQRGLIPAHTICNVAVSWALRKITLFVTAKNLLDELYLVDRSRGMIPGLPASRPGGAVDPLLRASRGAQVFGSVTSQFKT